MEQRESGLDLVRCLALLFVVSFHGFLNNGYYYAPQVGFSMWLAGSARWLSTSCIGLFLMLTGYLKSPRTGLWDCWRSGVPVLAGYLLAAAVSIPLRQFALGEARSLGDWIGKLFGFSAVYYGWYVGMFLGLTLLSPFVNRGLERLNDRELLALAGVLLVLTALPGAFPGARLPRDWRSLYPLSDYVLGAIVRRRKPKLRPWIGLTAALGLAAALGGATVLSTDGPLKEAVTWEFADLWITALAALLFLSLYRLRLPAPLARVLRFAAGGCYGGYLLSYLLDAWCYRLLPQWRNPAEYGKLFLCITVPIFLLSVLAGRALEGAAARLTAGVRCKDRTRSEAPAHSGPRSPRPGW